MPDSAVVVGKDKAAAIVAEATATHEIKLSGVAYQQLFAIQKYKQRDKLAMHGATRLEKERAEFAVSHVEELISSEFELIEKRMKDADQKDRDNLFRSLCAKGVPVAEAYDLAYKSK